MAKITVAALTLTVGGQTVNREFPNIYEAVKDIAVGARMAKALTGSDLTQPGDVFTIRILEREETPDEEQTRMAQEAGDGQLPVCPGCGKRHPVRGMRVVDLSSGQASPEVEELLRNAGLLQPGQHLGPRPTDENPSR